MGFISAWKKKSETIYWKKQKGYLKSTLEFFLLDIFVFMFIVILWDNILSLL